MGVVAKARVLHVEQRRQLAADTRTVVNDHALGAIYIDPQRGVMMPADQLHIHELKTERIHTWLEQVPPIWRACNYLAFCHASLPDPIKQKCARPTSRYTPSSAGIIGARAGTSKDVPAL